MPRRARLGLLGIPWHIIQRGNNRSVCFFAEKDHRLYLSNRGRVHRVKLHISLTHRFLYPGQLQPRGEL